MKEQRWDGYLREILSFVKFKYDHKAIRRELTEHMEDCYEACLAEGADEAGAVEMTLISMGKAAEIGQALNREHNPLLGWIWRISRAAFLVILLLCLPAVGRAASMAIGTATTAFQDYQIPYPQLEKELLYRAEVEESLWIDDVKLTIEEIRYYDTGEMHICYNTYYRENGEMHTWEGGYHEPWTVTDEKGNNGQWEWRGSRGNNIFRKHIASCEGIPLEAEKLYVTLGREWYSLSFEIPLDWKEAAK